MMVEGEEHKQLKTCAVGMFDGQAEKSINGGRVDVKTRDFCIEVETSERADRILHAAEKLSSSECGCGLLVVPPNAMEKAERIAQHKDIIVVPIDMFKRICKNQR